MSTLDGDTPCKDCGTEENIIWFTDSILWNNVIGTKESAILCLRCFVKRVEDAGLEPKSWRVMPEWPWHEDEEKHLAHLKSLGEGYPLHDLLLDTSQEAHDDEES